MENTEIQRNTININIDNLILQKKQMKLKKGFINNISHKKNKSKRDIKQTNNKSKNNMDYMNGLYNKCEHILS